MWRFYWGRWRSVPLDLTRAPMVPGLFRELSRLAVESGEDVELYAAELGISREVAHRA